MERHIVSRLVEKMAAEMAAFCLEDPRVEEVNSGSRPIALAVSEKPGALRFTRSVGVEIHRPLIRGPRPVLSPHRPGPVEGSKGADLEA